MKVSILFEVNYKIFTTYCDVENIIRICLFEDTVSFHGLWFAYACYSFISQLLCFVYHDL